MPKFKRHDPNNKKANKNKKRYKNKNKIQGMKQHDFYR